LCAFHHRPAIRARIKARWCKLELMSVAGLVGDATFPTKRNGRALVGEV